MPTTYAIAAAAAALAVSAHVVTAFAPASLPSAPRTRVAVNHERETTEWPRAAPCLTETALRRSVDECLAADGEWKKNVALIGSTGSIGTQTLDIVRARPDRFSVVSLAAGSNVELLAQQAAEFKETVKVVSIGDTSKVGALKTRLDELGVKGMDVVAGAEGPTAAATLDEADVVVTGIVGCAGLLPTVEAIKKGKNIALANKETLISGAPYIIPLLEKYGATMTPADSEHSAIFQCLQGVPPGAMRKVILTASGGAFRDFDAATLRRMAKEEPDVVRKKATTHPNWDMGAKITVDSATMMNKGLEVIEAHYLFGADYDDIDVVVHPQSIVHSAIETQDNSVIAQMGWPDMRLPILYSIAWPHRVRMPQAMWEDRFDLVKLGSMTFNAPDYDKYPCIPLAFEAGRKGGTMTGALNAANEMANELFRENKGLDYFDIPRVIESAMEAHKADWVAEPTLDDILHTDAWAREYVAALAKKGLALEL